MSHFFNKRAGFMLKATAALFLAGLVQAAGAQADLPALHTDGQWIVNAQGIVSLRGVNIGGWYVKKSYMSPTDSAGKYTDEYRILSELSSRFGETEAEATVNTYIQNWITADDITTTSRAGMDVVRIPVWWGQFYKLAAFPTNGDPSPYLRADAFTCLDTIIAPAPATTSV